MKRLLAALCALTLLLACNSPSGPDYRLRGAFSDMNSGEIYVFVDGKSDARFDTLLVKNGKFVYAGQTNTVIALHIFFPNALEQVVFVGPGEELTYEARANDLGNFRVRGSAENELMNKFREEASRKDSTTVRRIARRYIEENTTSVVAVHLFERYFLQSPSAPAAERDSLLALLRTAQSDERHLLAAEGKLRRSRLAQVGDTLPALSVPLWLGDTLALPQVDSPCLLIAFWATWMERSWDFLNDIRHLYTDHHEADSLSVLAISLDTQTYEWEEHIRPDSTTILHACDGYSWDSPIVQPFGVYLLPTYLVCDRQGIIQTRSTKLADMQGDVERFLSDNAPK